MTEPLVSRNDDGIPVLRDTRLAPSELQSFADTGLSAAEIRAQWPYLLGDWSDSDIERVLTYPRVEMDVKEANYHVEVDEVGSISVDGWFDARDIPAVIAALEQAREVVEAWRRACDEWETSS